MPVKMDAAVVRLVEWQRLHPIWLNRLEPLVVDWVGAAGGAGASSRMDAAKLTPSDDISETVPTVVPKVGLLFLPFRVLLGSSGVAVKTRPAGGLRPLGKATL